MKLIEMKHKDIKELKEKIWLKNNKKCPVLDVEIPLEKCVLDHKHKLKNEEPGIDDKGLVREVLEFRINAFFGKIENNFKRLGLDKEFDLPTILKNGAEYLERGAFIDENGNKYIHPKEVKKKPKLKKSSFNRLEKVLKQEGKKVPKYTGNYTKVLEKLFKKYEIEPEFYEGKI